MDVEASIPSGPEIQSKARKRATMGTLTPNMMQITVNTTYNLLQDDRTILICWGKGRHTRLTIRYSEAEIIDIRPKSRRKVF